MKTSFFSIRNTIAMLSVATTGALGAWSVSAGKADRGWVTHRHGRIGRASSRTRE